LRWPNAVDRGIADEVDRIAMFLDRPLKIQTAKPLGGA
jgi:hypothetical protein